MTYTRRNASKNSAPRWTILLKPFQKPADRSPPARIRIEWRHIRMSGITALPHGDFHLASRRHAACHAATRISVIIAETQTGDNLAGAAQRTQAAAGRLIKEFEPIAALL